MDVTPIRVEADEWALPSTLLKAAQLAKSMTLSNFQKHLDPQTTIGNLSIIPLKEDREVSQFRDLILRAQPSDERWPIKDWIDTVAEGGFLLALFKKGKPIGFLGGKRILDIEIGDEERLSVCYSIRPTHVYLLPQARGKGLTEHLTTVVLDACERDFSIMSTHRETLSACGIEMEFEVFSMADSDEGEAFLERFRSQFDYRLNNFFPEQPNQLRAAF